MYIPRSRGRNKGEKSERERRIDWTRGCASTYVTGKRARRLCARVPAGARRARKVQRGSNRASSPPREEEDGARNLDKLDKDRGDGGRERGSERGRKRAGRE